MVSLKKELLNDQTVLTKSIRHADIFTEHQNKIRKHIVDNFKSHEFLNRESIISPHTLHNIQYYDKRFFDWHRHTWSGRSFSKWFMRDNKKHTFTVKWGHLLEKWEIRDPKISWLLATPAWWSESVKQLLTEFRAAEYLQNLSLETTWELAPFPIPLKLNTLHKYKYEGKHVDYRHFMTWIFGSFKSHRDNLWNVLVHQDIWIHYKTDEWRTFIKEEFRPFEKLIERYRDHIWDHGSYLYISQWTNMRLADIFSMPTKEEMQKAIRSHYPKEYSDEQICKTFMETFWQARWTINASWLVFKPGLISNCYPVDTTIMWNTMDIDWYTYHEEYNKDQFIDITKHHWVYSELSFFFYSIFFPASIKEFLTFHNTHFIDTYINHFLKIHAYRTQKESSQLPNHKQAYNALFKCYVHETAAYIKRNIWSEKNPRADKKYLNDFLSKIEITK